MERGNKDDNSDGKRTAEREGISTQESSLADSDDTDIEDHLEMDTPEIKSEGSDDENIQMNEIFPTYRTETMSVTSCSETTESTNNEIVVNVNRSDDLVPFLPSTENSDSTELNQQLSGSSLNIPENVHENTDSESSYLQPKRSRNDDDGDNDINDERPMTSYQAAINAYERQRQFLSIIQGYFLLSNNTTTSRYTTITSDTQSSSDENRTTSSNLFPPFYGLLHGSTSTSTTSTIINDMISPTDSQATENIDTDPFEDEENDNNEDDTDAEIDPKSDSIENARTVTETSNMVENIAVPFTNLKIEENESPNIIEYKNVIFDSEPSGTEILVSYDHNDHNYYARMNSFDFDFKKPQLEIPSKIKIQNNLLDTEKNPTKKMKRAQTNDFSLTALSKDSSIFENYIQSRKITVNNICEVFNILLQIEDLTIMKEYLQFMQTNVYLEKQNRQFVVNFKHMQQVSNIGSVINPLFDQVICVPKNTLHNLLANVNNVDKYKVDILFCTNRFGSVIEINNKFVKFEFQKWEPNTKTKYDILFRPCRKTICSQYKSLKLLSRNTRLRRYLCPCSIPYGKPATIRLNLVNSTIAANLEQLQAVRNIAEGPNPFAPYILFGPPGTGKTTTICEAILQIRFLKAKSFILVTASSNSACDTLALKICKYMDKEVVSKFVNLLRIYSKSAHLKGLSHVDPLLLLKSNCSRMKYSEVEIGNISEYNVIVATLSTVSQYVNFVKFTHIFIDEAGACTEPEVLQAIVYAYNGINTNVILSGDHKQLGPIVKAKSALKLGLNLSLMERLLKYKCYMTHGDEEYDQTLQTRLKINFRSHPQIVRLYNQLYYNNELVPKADPETNLAHIHRSELINPKFPIIFYDVQRIMSKHPNSRSYSNYFEIEVVLWYIIYLLNDDGDGRGVKQKEIGVITPYNLQATIIKKKLLRYGLPDIDVGSVEMFQGREKSVIIVSFVRSFSGLGFVADPQRINVILSRPKSLLIIIGNASTLRKNQDIKYVIDECHRMGTLIDKRKRSGMSFNYKINCLNEKNMLYFSSISDKLDLFETNIKYKIFHREIRRNIEYTISYVKKK